jgi:hypothetical protein
MRTKEIKISFTLKSPTLFLKIKKRNKKEFIPDIEVAKAIPPILKGNMNIEFRTIFVTKARNEIFMGVTVSLSAKKQDCRTLVAP